MFQKKSGNVSGIMGTVSGISCNIDEYSLTEEGRNYGINITQLTC